MSGLFDPPHERVRLTVKELQALRMLEQSLSCDDSRMLHPSGAHVEARPRSVRARVALAARRWAWTLVPLGVAVICLGLARSLAFGVLGSLIVAVGLAITAGRSGSRMRSRRARGLRRDVG